MIDFFVNKPFTIIYRNATDEKEKYPIAFGAMYSLENLATSRTKILTPSVDPEKIKFLDEFGFFEFVRKQIKIPLSIYLQLHIGILLVMIIDYTIFKRALSCFVSYKGIRGLGGTIDSCTPTPNLEMSWVTISILSEERKPMSPEELASAFG